MSYESQDPCTCCGIQIEKMVCFHHIYRRKSYPEYSECTWNKIPVCQLHHNEFHNQSTVKMAQKYNGVMNFLINHHWEYDSFNNKWIHPWD